MSLPLPGDPASCSYAGGSLRLLASRLRVVGRRAQAAIDDPGTARPLPAEVRAIRHADALDRVAAESTRQLDRLGSTLQAFATDLAESQAAAARLAERAEAAGLRLHEGILSAPWGVSGIADARATTSQDAVRTAIQSELDAVISTLAHRRQRLLAALRETQDVVGRQRSALRPWGQP